MNFFDSAYVNEAEWARSGCKGAAFCHVAKEVAGETVSARERALVQAAEDRIGLITEQYLVLADPKTWSDKIEAARTIKEPDRMVAALSDINRDQSNVPNALSELQRSIDAEIKLLYPVAIRLLENVVKRLDVEIAKIKVDQVKADEFWGLQTVESSNWLLFGILRLKSALESQVNSLRTNEPGQTMSIPRHALNEAGVLEAKARIYAP